MWARINSQVVLDSAYGNAKLCGAALNTTGT